MNYTAQPVKGHSPIPFYLLAALVMAYGWGYRGIVGAILGLAFTLPRWGGHDRRRRDMPTINT